MKEQGIRSLPRKGCFHPASTSDIVSLINFFGEECIYGIRSIELVQGGESRENASVDLATLAGAGRILLFDQPPSPWRVAGRLKEAQAEELLSHGSKR